jgi:hypothetical protein
MMAQKSSPLGPNRKDDEVQSVVGLMRRWADGNKPSSAEFSAAVEACVDAEYDYLYGDNPDAGNAHALSSAANFAKYGADGHPQSVTNALLEAFYAGEATENTLGWITNQLRRCSA